MKIDWEKARSIAAKRFEDVIMACNNHDENAIQDCMESGMAVPEDYTLEDDDMRLDEKGCFMYHGFVCQICNCYEQRKWADEGPAFYVCRVAIYDNRRSVHDWIIIPYVIKDIYNDVVSKRPNFIRLLDEYITEDMHPVSYEVITNAMV